jgi:SAM-dependent methyltransferase
MFNVNFLNNLRAAELDLIADELRSAKKLLEFGAGTGAQARMLQMRGFEVVAIDLPQSGYAESRVYPILEYDGRSIPITTGTIDVVFSSNVLEHVDNLPATFAEFHRVTRAGGYGVHVMPSVAWRIWTLLAGFPTSVVAAFFLLRGVFYPVSGFTRRESILRYLKMISAALLPIGHGTSREGVSELWTFSTKAWKSKFTRNGFQVISCRPIGIFHTGHMLFGPQISISFRQKLSRWLGSAANVYVVRSLY